MLKSILLLSAMLLVAAGKENQLDDKVREVEEFKVSKDKVQMKAKAKLEEIEDKLEFSIEARGNDGLETKFKYHVKEKGKGGLNSKFEMRMKVFKIVEFIDKDGGVDGWDENDEILQEFVIGKKDKSDKPEETGEEWEDITEETVDEGETKVRTFTLQTTSGTFKVVGRYAPKAVNFDADTTVGNNVVFSNYKLQPNAIKFDYIINNFPYINTQNKSRLAIDGRFKMKSKNKARRKSSDATAIEVPNEDGGSGGASFSWVPQVNVDGEMIDVTAGLRDASDADEVDKKKENEVNQKLVWTVTKPGKFASIVWDPTFEAHTYGSGAMSVAPSLTLAVLCLLAYAFGQQG